MNLLTLFQQHIKAQDLFRKSDGLLIAISGGMDSVVLTHLCHVSGYKVSLAHMNFCLRGVESERDEQFLRALAGRLSLPLFVHRVDARTYAAENKLSIQESARILRYSWFRELIRENQDLQYLCTAHHADDNIETVLMNLFRGTGVSGLRGILPKQDNIIRPLLFASRKMIEAYAKQEQLAYVEDSSNQEEKYTRNFFRLQVIPMVEKVYPSAGENMRQNIERFREVEFLYRQMVILKTKKLVQEKKGEWHIPVEKLRHEIPLNTIVHEIFSGFGFSVGQASDIINLMDSDTGKFIHSSTHRLLKNRNWFIVTPLQTVTEEIVVVPAFIKTTYFAGGEISLAEKKLVAGQSLDADPGTACIDANVIEYPLMIRRWKTGDYFYPLGMRKKKKLSRFFIDRKMSQHEKENTWVLESAGRIIWVIGQRIDDRCKVQPHTQKMIILRWIKNLEIKIPSG